MSILTIHNKLMFSVKLKCVIKLLTLLIINPEIQNLCYSHISGAGLCVDGVFGSFIMTQV